MPWFKSYVQFDILLIFSTGEVPSERVCHQPGQQAYFTTKKSTQFQTGMRRWDVFWDMAEGHVNYQVRNVICRLTFSLLNLEDYLRLETFPAGDIYFLQYDGKTIFGLLIQFINNSFSQVRPFQMYMKTFHTVMIHSLFLNMLTKLHRK